MENHSSEEMEHTNESTATGTQPPAKFNFFLPASPKGRDALIRSLCIIGMLSFFRGCVVTEMAELSWHDKGYGGSTEERCIWTFVLWVIPSMAAWYLLVNSFRLLAHRGEKAAGSAGVHKRPTGALSEWAELQWLKRRLEIQKLKRQLGELDEKSDSSPQNRDPFREHGELKSLRRRREIQKLKQDLRELENKSDGSATGDPEES